MNNRIILSIRVLPNDKATFRNESEFRNFIEITMHSPDRQGKYYFPGMMMRCSANTLVLFQYNNMIRAVGLMMDSAKTHDEKDENGVKYAGYYRFDTSTLKYLATPISADMMKTIYPDFRGFSQCKQIIPLECLDRILSLI